MYYFVCTILSNTNRFMQITNLTNTNFQSIVDCFNAAFANYFVTIHATNDYLKRRWKGARIDPALSFGVFDEGKLVAFMFIGVDTHYGKLTAHNDGTGVIPAYRGRRLVDKMYEQAIPKFIAKGITQCSLEVIQENARAIKVYERLGFKKIRGVNCYGGVIINKNTAIPTNLSIQKTAQPKWDLYEQCFDFVPCWNNSLAWVKAIQDTFDIVELYDNGVFAGFAAVDDSGSLPIFGIHPTFRRRKYGQNLIAYLAQTTPSLRTNNVADTAIGTLQFLEKIGMKNSINQHEMLLSLVE